jgi:muconolactone delta-isomerase
MAEFLADLYMPKSAAAAVESAAARARAAADELSAEGTPIRCVRSIFVPDDETCFFLFEADSVDAVHDAAGRAGLRLEHVAMVGTPQT